MGFLSFQLPSEAEIPNLKIALLAIPVSDGKIAVAPPPRDSGWKLFFGDTRDLLEDLGEEIVWLRIFSQIPPNTAIYP